MRTCVIALAAAAAVDALQVKPQPNVEAPKHLSKRAAFREAGRRAGRKQRLLVKPRNVMPPATSSGAVSLVNIHADPETVNTDPKTVNADPKTVNADPKTVNADPKTIPVEPVLGVEADPIVAPAAVAPAATGSVVAPDAKELPAIPDPVAAVGGALFDEPKNIQKPAAHTVVKARNFLLKGIQGPSTAADAKSMCETFWNECEATEGEVVPDRLLTKKAAKKPECAKVEALFQPGLLSEEIVGETLSATDYHWACETAIFRGTEIPEPSDPKIVCHEHWEACSSQQIPAVAEHEMRYVDHKTAVDKCPFMKQMIKLGHLAESDIPEKLYADDYLEGCVDFFEGAQEEEDKLEDKLGDADVDFHMMPTTAPPEDACFAFWNSCEAELKPKKEEKKTAEVEPMFTVLKMAEPSLKPKDVAEKCPGLLQAIHDFDAEVVKESEVIDRAQFVAMCTNKIKQQKAGTPMSKTFSEIKQHPEWMTKCSNCYDGCHSRTTQCHQDAVKTNECQMCDQCESDLLGLSGCENIFGFNDIQCAMKCTTAPESGCQACYEQHKQCGEKKDIVNCFDLCNEKQCPFQTSAFASTCGACFRSCDDRECYMKCTNLCGYEETSEGLEDVDPDVADPKAREETDLEFDTKPEEDDADDDNENVVPKDEETIGVVQR